MISEDAEFNKVRQKTKLRNLMNHGEDNIKSASTVGTRPSILRSAHDGQDLQTARARQRPSLATHRAPRTPQRGI
jgi:hypothetical protein